jgi:hypothetical protein
MITPKVLAFRKISSSDFIKLAERLTFFLCSNVCLQTHSYSNQEQMLSLKGLSDLMQWTRFGSLSSVQDT